MLEDWVKSTLLNRVNIDYAEQCVKQYCDFPTTPRDGICIVGPSGCGKDTIAKLLCRLFPIEYRGTSSLTLCKFLYPESVPYLYANRHEVKEMLFNFGNMVRSIDPLAIPKYTMSVDSDLLVGLRSPIDLSAAVDAELIGTIVWVSSNHNDDVTLDFNLEQLLKTYSAKRVRVINNYHNGVYSDGAYLVSQVIALGRSLDYEFDLSRLTSLDLQFERHGVRYFDVR